MHFLHFNYLIFIIFLVPCYYLYCKNLVFDTKIFNYRELSHFIFPLIFVGSNLLLKFFVNESYLVISIYFILFLLLQLAYVYKSYLLLSVNVWSRRSEIESLSEQNKTIKIWTFILFSVSLLLLLKSTISIYIYITTAIPVMGGSTNLWIAALLVDMLFLRLLLFPNILWGYNTMHKRIESHRKFNYVLKDVWIKQLKKQISNPQDEILHQKIVQLIPTYIHDIENMLLKYGALRDPSFDINDISNKLHIPKSHLTFLFKYYSKIGFVDFKKIIRVYDAIDLIDNHYLKSNSLESLSNLVGFSSYNPFFTSFKQIIGLTPQQYYMKLIKSSRK